MSYKWKQNSMMTSTIHGNNDNWIVKFDRHLSSWRGNTSANNSSFASSSTTYFKQSRRKARPNCEVCKRKKVTRALCRRNRDDRTDRVYVPERFDDVITAKPQVPMKIKSRQSITNMWMCKTWRLNGFQVIHAKNQMSSRNVEKSSTFITSKIKCKLHYYGQIWWNLFKLADRWNGIMRDLFRAATNGIAERVVRRVKYKTSSLFAQSGLKESWWAEAMECHY